MKRKTLATLGVSFAVLAVSLAGPRETVVAPSPSQTPPFEIRVGTPGWLSGGVRGQVGVGRAAANIDLPFEKVLQNIRYLRFVLLLDTEIRYKRWLFLMDGLYLDLLVPAEPQGLVGLAFDKATVHLSQGLLEGALGYRLVDWARGRLDLFGGFRLNYVYSRLDLSAARPRFPQIRQLLTFIRDRLVTDTETWVDPIIGGRLKLRLARPLWAFCRADVGGLDLGSDFTWQSTPDWNSKWLAMRSWTPGGSIFGPITSPEALPTGSRPAARCSNLA